MKISIKLLLSAIFILSIHIPNSQSHLYETVSNIAKSAKDLTKGALEKIPSALPTPSDLFQKSKNLLVGYPFEYVFSAINTICSAAVSTSNVRPRYTPNIYNMSFLLMTPIQNYSFPLNTAEEMWLSPAFDKNKNTVFLITGWKTDLNETNDAIIGMSKAFFCRSNVNFVVLDSARFIDTLYTWSAFNTEEIGHYVGEALILFAKYGEVEKIHLIGHSLGAHICGAAGRAFTRYSGRKLPRITGLDPAKPCFSQGEKLSGLQRGDAIYIDVVHSNPGALGKKESVGDVDFYPNGLQPLPPGCFSVTCAHSRAWQYYAETVIPGNEFNFMGVRCSSLHRLKEGNCQGAEVAMGYAVPLDTKGDYFLKVNTNSPYGVNATADDIQCNDPSITYT